MEYPIRNQRAKEMLVACKLGKGPSSISGKNLGAFMFGIGDMDEIVVAKVKEEFHEKLPVAVRSTVCSIDEPIDVTIKDRRYKIKNIEEVLSSGTEKTDFSDNVMMFTTIRPDSENLDYYTHTYLIQTSQDLREKLQSNPDAAKKIFPMILVYDKKTLDELLRDHSVYPPKSLDKALLKIYVFDYPHKSIDTVF